MVNFAPPEYEHYVALFLYARFFSASAAYFAPFSSRSRASISRRRSLTSSACASARRAVARSEDAMNFLLTAAMHFSSLSVSWWCTKVCTHVRNASCEMLSRLLERACFGGAGFSVVAWWRCRRRDSAKNALDRLLLLHLSRHLLVVGLVCFAVIHRARI